ncbi:hypothetical protein DVH05_013381 [Phytophthora capsici]|nr:hypothetical protein DVH05_013381 [Phytophthora capsici]
MITAADHGHLNVVKWLHEQGVQLTGTAAIDCATRSNCLAVVEWLINVQHHKDQCTEILLDAVAKGRLDIVQCLHEKLNTSYTTAAMDGAARGGHIHVIMWLHSNTNTGCTTSAMDWASRNGHLNVVKWLHANRTEGCTTWAMEWAALGGHLDVVQWLHDNRSEGCSDKAMDNAAKYGHLHVVKWLHANRTEGCTPTALNEAAANGHLQVVQWLYENRREGSTPVALVRALMRAHFDVVLFLHSHCSESFSFLASTFVRQLPKELLQWLLDNYADKVDGCAFEVPNSDWRFNHWCAKVNLRRARGDDTATWWVCESASLQLHGQ